MLAASAMAPCVLDLLTHNNLNHSTTENLAWIEREYPVAAQYILKHGTKDRPTSFKASIKGKVRRKPFVNTSRNFYAPLDAI